MRFKKFFYAILLFLLVEGALYYGFQWYFSGQLLEWIFGQGVLQDPSVQAGMATLQTHCDLFFYFKIAGLVSIAYLVFSFHAPVRPLPQEDALYQNHLYQLLDGPSKQVVDGLNTQERERFYREFEEQLWVKYHTNRRQYLSPVRRTHLSGMVRFLRLVIGWCLAIAIGLQVVQVYTLNRPIVQQAKAYRLASNTQTDTNGMAMPAIEVVTADDAAYASEIADIQAAIDQMPSFLLTRCKKIYIMDEAHYLEAGQTLHMKGLADSAAFSYSSDMSIRIRIVDQTKVANTYLHTVAHELSHIFDFSQGNAHTDPSGCANTDEFLALYHAHPQSLSAYGASSQYEFFAEGGALYITAPDTLAAQNIDVYQYFDRLYGPYLK